MARVTRRYFVLVEVQQLQSRTEFQRGSERESGNGREGVEWVKWGRYICRRLTSVCWLAHVCKRPSKGERERDRHRVNALDATCDFTSESEKERRKYSWERKTDVGGNRRKREESRAPIAKVRREHRSVSTFTPYSIHNTLYPIFYVLALYRISLSF